MSEEVREKRRAFGCALQLKPDDEPVQKPKQSKCSSKQISLTLSYETIAPKSSQKQVPKYSKMPAKHFALPPPPPSSLPHSNPMSTAEQDQTTTTPSVQTEYIIASWLHSAPCETLPPRFSSSNDQRRHSPQSIPPRAGRSLPPPDRAQRASSRAPNTRAQGPQSRFSRGKCWTHMIYVLIIV